MCKTSPFLTIAVIGFLYSLSGLGRAFTLQNLLFVLLTFLYSSLQWYILMRLKGYEAGVQNQYYNKVSIMFIVCVGFVMDFVFNLTFKNGFFSILASLIGLAGILYLNKQYVEVYVLKNKSTPIEMFQNN